MPETKVNTVDNDPVSKDIKHQSQKGDVDDFIFKNEEIKHCSER